MVELSKSYDMWYFLDPYLLDFFPTDKLIWTRSLNTSLPSFADILGAPDKWTVIHIFNHFFISTLLSVDFSFMLHES
jgi:hypothetical protein